MLEQTREEALERLEHQKEKTKEKLEFAQRVERLLNNLDFKAVIMENYCTKEAAAFVHQSCDPILKPEQRADSLSMAQATGHLKRWLQVQMTMQRQMLADLPQIDEVIENLRGMSDEDYANMEAE